MSASAVPDLVSVARCHLERAVAAQREFGPDVPPFGHPAEIGRYLADLRQVVAAVSELVAVLPAQLRDPATIGRLDSVDGPFRGDLEAALGTAELWSGGAVAECAAVVTAIENLHIALGGLAERRPG
jgi:hypothetical protein